MRYCTFLAALLALCNWTFVMSGKAVAHGGTDFAVLDCEDEDGDKTERTFDCEDDDGDKGDSQRAVLDCEDEDGDKDGAAVLDCHDDDDDGGDKS